MKETTITLRVHLKELKNMDKAGSEISGGIQENAEWEKAQLPAPTFASVFVIFPLPTRYFHMLQQDSHGLLSIFLSPPFQHYFLFLFFLLPSF